MRVYSMKNILHDVTNKTFACINNFFKKCNTLFTKPVKKIIHPGEIQEKKNIIRAAKHNIEQQWEEILIKRYVSEVLPLLLVLNIIIFLCWMFRRKSKIVKKMVEQEKIILITDLCKKLNMNLQLHSLVAWSYWPIAVCLKTNPK